MKAVCINNFLSTLAIYAYLFDDMFTRPISLMVFPRVKDRACFFREVWIIDCFILIIGESQSSNGLKQKVADHQRASSTFRSGLNRVFLLPLHGTSVVGVEDGFIVCDKHMDSL